MRRKNRTEQRPKIGEYRRVALDLVRMRMSQADLARELKTHKSLVSLYARGIRRIPVRLRSQAAKVLELVEGVF